MGVLMAATLQGRHDYDNINYYFVKKLAQSE